MGIPTIGCARALELKLFEDQKDSIKLTSLVSNVIDSETQAKIEVVKSRLIKNYGLLRRVRYRRAELRRQHFRARRHRPAELTGGRS